MCRWTLILVLLTRGFIALATGVTGLVAFEMGSAAGEETLLTAEALDLTSHEERESSHTLPLAPHTLDEHVGRLLHCRWLNEGHNEVGGVGVSLLHGRGGGGVGGDGHGSWISLFCFSMFTNPPGLAAFYLAPWHTVLPQDRHIALDPFVLHSSLLLHVHFFITIPA